MQLALEAGCVLEHLLELVDVLPFLLPVVALRVVEQGYLFVFCLVLAPSYLELADLILHLQPIYVDLVLHAVKLVVPPSRNVLLLNH